MTLTVVVLTPTERFLRFLDTDLCSITETIDYQGLRTIDMEYTFQELTEDKELFKQGNKIWVQGDRELKDCLYIINTEVEEDAYKEHSFSFTAEEVLVELNYAPLFSHLELSAKDTNNQAIFKRSTTNGKEEVTIDWNALNYWFGDYFNICVVQDCLNKYAQKISLTGTYNLMSLLRFIEEETGNIFVTHYEKDILNNTIHRYLNFLNPIDINKNWTFHTEYTFIDTNVLSVCYDNTGIISEEHEIPEEKGYQATPTWPADFTPMEPDQVDTDIEDYEDPVESEYEYIREAETSEPGTYAPLTNLDPEYMLFRVTDKEGDVQISTDGETPLEWTAEECGLTSEDDNVVIRLVKNGDDLGVEINTKSYIVSGEHQTEMISTGFIHVADDETLTTPYPAIIEDNSYFEIYDTEHDKVVYRALIDNKIGAIHPDVLDFGFNIENVIYNVDESETFKSVSPIIQLNENSNNGLTRTQIGNLISSWKSLSITKGATIPLAIEKISVNAPSFIAARSTLGTFNRATNYWVRPVNPNDNLNTGSGDNTYEFYRATSYWKAPYTKKAGTIKLVSDNYTTANYTDVYQRNDTRNEKGSISQPKMGTVDTTEDNIYLIYKELSDFLKEHEEPKVDVQVDVANITRNGEYISYDLHDKVYIKLPESSELITARVTNTTKEAHDIAKNSIALGNYVNKNLNRTVQESTFITCNNVSFRYPATKTINARLTNEDYDSSDSESIEHPANKLITFTIYTVSGGSRTLYRRPYTKLTNAYGYATLNLALLPGNYEVDIRFGGDELYMESLLTIKVNVSGTREVAAKMTERPKAKTTTTNKTTTKTKTVTTYWTKCGLSPDKKKIISVAQPSAGESGYSWSQLYKATFRNRCPECGREGTLRFDGGKWNACITSSTYGVNWKPDVPEHEITCIACDSDFDGVTGLEKDWGHSTRLTRLSKPVKSDKSEFARLVKGKLVYATKKVTIKNTNKSTVNSRSNRKYRSKNLSSYLKSKAEAIVGNSIGIFAAKKIAEWMDNHVSYKRYCGFCNSPETVIKTGRANCCDGTRAFFALCDAAGCCEYLYLDYVHVTGHVYGKVTTIKTGSWRWVDTASDYHEAWGYVCRDYPRSSTAASRYPNLPFEDCSSC